MDVNEVPKEQGEARRRRIRKNLEECLRLGVEDRGAEWEGQGKARSCGQRSGKRSPCLEEGGLKKEDMAMEPHFQGGVE